MINLSPIRSEESLSSSVNPFQTPNQGNTWNKHLKQDKNWPEYFMFSQIWVVHFQFSQRSSTENTRLEICLTQQSSTGRAGGKSHSCYSKITPRFCLWALSHQSPALELGFHWDPHCLPRGRGVYYPFTPQHEGVIKHHRCKKNPHSLR